MAVKKHVVRVVTFSGRVFQVIHYEVFGMVGILKACMLAIQRYDSQLHLVPQALVNSLRVSVCPADSFSALMSSTVLAQSRIKHPAWDSGQVARKRVKLDIYQPEDDSK